LLGVKLHSMQIKVSAGGLKGVYTIGAQRFYFKNKLMAIKYPDVQIRLATLMF